jgi:hypothetical protein
MEERESLQRATELWQEAYRDQMEGELDRAIEIYRRSIAVYPTAEAHTSSSRATTTSHPVRG